MQHPEQDELILLALGEQTDDPASADHLAGCAECAAEVTELRELAGVIAHTETLRVLPTPPDRIWQSISAELAEITEAPTGASAMTADLPRQPLSGPPGRSHPPAGRPRTRRKRVRAWMGALAAVAVAAVLAVTGVWRAVGNDTDPPVTVVASAELTAYGDTPASARGAARLIGGPALQLEVADLPGIDNGYYEVWLIDPDTSTMFSVGVLGSAQSATLNLPANADLKRFRLVDISAEHFDNNAAHSGRSLLRGTLGA